METMNPYERDRIFGDGGLASRAKSQLTKDIIREMSPVLKEIQISK